MRNMGLCFMQLLADLSPQKNHYARGGSEHSEVTPSRGGSEHVEVTSRVIAGRGESHKNIFLLKLHHFGVSGCTIFFTDFTRFIIV